MITLWELSKAEIKEKMRNYSFIIMIILSLFMAYFFVPRQNQFFQIMQISRNTFIQAGNISWITIGCSTGISIFFRQ